MRCSQDISVETEMPDPSGCDCHFQACTHCLSFYSSYSDECRVHLEGQGQKKHRADSTFFERVDASSQREGKTFPTIDFDGVMGSVSSPPTPHAERSPTRLRFVLNLDWAAESSNNAADQNPSLEPIDTLRVDEEWGPMRLPQTPEKERQGTKLMISADNCYRTLVEDHNDYSSVSEKATKEGTDPCGTFTVATPDIPMGEIQERLSRSATAG